MPRNRDERFTIRLTADEKAFITGKMRESGFNNLADYFLHCVSNNYTVVVDVLPMLSVKNELNKIGCNINQIAKKANTYGFLSEDSVCMLMDNMKEVRNTVNTGVDVFIHGNATIDQCKCSTCQANAHNKHNNKMSPSA
ncbi:MAG: plasmid mobilization relaxosome protein MobC [Firmicutes bacterium]|nr:plasmid mobilization relaxosome protein MobC [Bacillota bacterium]